jgi:uncharacterized repeat protein (TIGR01451 family)
LTRGNDDPNDDVEVLQGQTWISVTSPEEGTTYVTAFSPDVYSWDLHKQMTTIHWVDAQWQFPPPAINPAGTSHLLTTTVMKQSIHAPCEGWIVRYEIVGGPPAGFRPDGAQAVEVATDAAGQASAELFQEQPAPGTNLINIQVIRPGGVAGGNGKRLVIGSGSTSKTWSAPGLAVQLSGPSVAAVDSTVTYRINVSNPGDLPAQEVVVTNPVPSGLRYLASRPAGESGAGAVRWQLGTLGPGQTQSLEVDFQAQQVGSVENCAEAASAEGLTARDCLTTRVAVSDLEVRILGPEEATVGQEVTFEIVITNRGQVPASRLLIKDRFDTGLEHPESGSPIERDLGTIAAGQSRSIGVVFRVMRAGQLCHTVEVLRGGRVLASARACVTGVEPARPQPPPAVQPEPPTEPERPETLPGLEPPPVPPRVSLEVAGPDNRTVGETAEFVITVTNSGQQALSKLKVVSDFDDSLEPSMATDGFRFEEDDMLWVIDTLGPGATQEFKLQARCRAASPRAANRVRVEEDEQVLAEKEASLEIRPAPTPTRSNLSMVVADRMESVPTGSPVTYDIQVDNNGQATERQVSVVVVIPPELTLVPLETSGPPVAPGHKRDGNTIRFNPVPELEPGGRLLYRVRVRAAQPGEVKLRAQLSSQNLPQPIVVEEDTLIFEE